MRHVQFFKKAAAAMLSLGLLCSSVSALAYSDKNLDAPKAKDVIIDGDLSEWDMSRCLRIDNQSQITDQLEHWDGADDCSMALSAMWDEEALYLAVDIKDDTPFVYREGFPLDELDAIIFFLSTNPDADPARTAYEATDWRWTTSAEDYYGDWFNYIDRSMIEDNKGFETAGEYGDERVFDGDDYQAAFQKTDAGATYEIKLPWHYLSNEQIAQLVPVAGQSVGFDFSILDVDLPCPGIHSLRMQSSADLTVTGDRKPEMYDVDANPSLWGTLTFVEE